MTIFQFKNATDRLFVFNFDWIEYRSFVPPARDEESETQRKAHAKRVRETRRSTQGVTLEEIKSAEELVKKKNLNNNNNSNSNNNVSIIHTLSLFNSFHSSWQKIRRKKRRKTFKRFTEW